MPSLPNKATVRPWLPKPKPSQRKPYQLHSERTPLYDSPQWRRLRLAQLRKEPVCRTCKAKGRVTPAVVADHIKPYRDGADFFDATNLQSLCTPCHARKSAQEGHAKRKASSTPT